MKKWLKTKHKIKKKTIKNQTQNKEKNNKNQTQNKEKTNPKIKKKLPKQQAYPPSKIKN